MLRQMARKADKLTGQRQSGGNTRRVRVKPRLNDMFTRRRLATATPIQSKQRTGNIARQPHDFRHFAHRRARAISDDSGGDTGAFATIFLVNILDDFLAPLVLEININIGRLIALGRDETLKQ